MFLTRIPGRARLGLAALAAAAVIVPVAGAAGSAKAHSTSFSLSPNPAFVNCFKAPGKTPKANVTVTRGALNDTLTLKLSGFKPELDFDLFTVQRSSLDAQGAPVAGFTNFGLAWYQSDVQTDEDGNGTVKIKTILLDQIFGFDPDAGLNPLNTFHVGFWFNSPADAAACGFTGFTPFNGEHQAGPLAMISRPNARTNLGPLCTDPTGDVPAACNP